MGKVTLHGRALELVQPGPLLRLPVPVLDVVLGLSLPVAPGGVKGQVGLLALQVEPSVRVAEGLPLGREVRGHPLSDVHEGLNPCSFQCTQTTD